MNRHTVHYTIHFLQCDFNNPTSMYSLSCDNDGQSLTPYVPKEHNLFEEISNFHTSVSECCFSVNTNRRKHL